MFETSESLLKYENPVLVKTTTKSKSAQGRPPRVSPEQTAEFTPSPPPKAKSPHAEAAILEHEEILDIILPPRTWQQGKQLWIQKVSSAPCTRADVINLGELLDKKLLEKEARPMGICPIRRELYTQCFDELIRQVTITCAERGLLLLRVRDEIKMTIDAYQTLYESGIAFGMRKVLLADQGMDNMIQRISDLENENRDLARQLNEQKAMCDAIEKRETEKRQMEKKKYNQETEFLMKANQQLKSQLEGMITSKK